MHFPTKPRQIEWQHTLLLFATGAVLALPGETLKSLPVSHAMVDVMSERAWAALCLIVAIARVAALYINGSAPKGSPIARIICAVLGMVIFSLIAVAFLHAYPAGLWFGSVATIIAGYEGVAIFRATRDLKRACDHAAMA